MQDLSKQNQKAIGYWKETHLQLTEPKLSNGHFGKQNPPDIPPQTIAF